MMRQVTRHYTFIEVYIPSVYIYIHVYTLGEARDTIECFNLFL